MRLFLVICIFIMQLSACEPKRGYTGWWANSWEKGYGDVGMFYTYHKHNNYYGKFIDRDFKIVIDGDDFKLYLGKMYVGYDAKNDKPISKDAIFQGKFSENCKKIDAVWHINENKKINLYLDYNSSYHKIMRP